MTNFAPDNLSHVLDGFKSAFKSIDIRTVAVVPPSAENWQNLITSVILSDKTVEQIKTEHANLDPVRNFTSHNYFAIFMSAYAFNQLIFNQISNGEILFPESQSRANRVKIRVFDPLDLQVTSTQEQFGGSICYVLKAYGQNSLADRTDYWKIIQRQNTFANRFGFSDAQHLIQYYLKLTNFHYNTQTDFELTMSPLFKISNFQFLNKQLSVNIQKPSKITGLQLNVNAKRDSKIIRIKTYEIGAETESILFDTKDLLPFDLLTVELILHESGLTLDRLYINVPLENVAEPFVKTLDAFCSLGKLKRMLFEPQNYGKNPEKIFENAVAWLLSLAGFNTLYLGNQVTKINGKQEKFDKLEPNGYNIGSADIIAYEENRRLLLVDCDIGMVDPKKVHKLVELKKHFREQLKGYEKLPIVPVLFTPKDFREQSPNVEVMIADRAVIQRIFESVITGNTQNGRSNFYYYGK